MEFPRFLVEFGVFGKLHVASEELVTLAACVQTTRSADRDVLNQRPLLGETPLAIVALESLFLRMRQQVSRVRRLLPKALPTFRAPVLPIARVYVRVLVQFALVTERVAAGVALKCLREFVDGDVLGQSALVEVRASALVALKVPYPGMRFRVVL